ncbi:uncharacterized protein H6S33_001616 [Morchella sextelata]|uniref:uncharacterized protein n=1 Tax=Morchella sextelata TaxID=1174677 RepID=UPI001D0452EF|nr:uncharacterized protein H6S33_001616 [Morchella sextelata]KAH0608482.1 hypothetical protein H6S33_001616 [Morchella sextelata]
MATPPKHSSPSDGRKSPSNRKVPHALTTTFFAKSKKSGEARSPTFPSPTIQMRGYSNRQGGGEDVGSSEMRSEPIGIPQSPSVASNRPKKLAPNTFNSHYRTISRSMNDLGNIFSRGRSPPNREPSPRRTGGGPLNTLPEGRRKDKPDSPRLRTIESGSVPSISVMQHGEYVSRESIVKEGWVNMIDSNSVKKGPLREAWKLQHIIITGGYLMLYKPSSSLQIRSFDISAVPSSPPRPQSAPATAAASFNVSTLRHKSTSRHPELVLGADGAILGGTVEALCHELMFTDNENDQFIQGATRTLAGWASPETALSIFIELTTLRDLSARVAWVLTLFIESAPGMLLEPGCYNSARLLLEKGITPHNPDLAKDLRAGIEARASRLQEELSAPADQIKEPSTPSSTDIFSTLSTSLPTEEFMRLNPETFATQVHLFHLKYLQAWNPENDLSLLLASPHLPPPTHRNPLIFTSTNIHFLGERVLSHVLSGDSTANSVDRRASILSQWLKVGSLLRKKADMVGYLAIVMAVLSPPILRLRETWSLLDNSLIEDIENGAKLMRILERRRLEESDSYDHGRILVPDLSEEGLFLSEVVPYFGDLCHCMDEAYASRVRNVDYPKFIQGMEAIFNSLEKWREEWVDAGLGLDRVEKKTPREVEQIQKCLFTLNLNNKTPPSTNSTTFFDMSLACEPSSTGMYLHSHYHQRLPLSTGAHVPLVFTDVLPSFSLFDREDTLAISGSLHKKTPSSGLASPSYGPGVQSQQQSGPSQSNQNLRPPTSSGQQIIRRTRSFPPSNDTSQTTGYDDLDYTTRERTAGLHGGDNAMLRAIRDVAGVGQQLFYSKDGELVLKSITEDAYSSRPSSVIETTNKRVSGSSRRISAQVYSNSTSPRISAHGDISVPQTPVRGGFELESFMPVVSKGGTLERLVDILVLGVEDFSKRMNASESNSPPPERPPLLKMNMDVFTITFFATFRSYCSPIVLIDYLKKRLLGSKSAATLSNDESDDVVFPDWTGPDNISDERIDWNLVARIHIGILEAMNIWISEFYIDFHSDQTLGDSFVSFLSIASKELSNWRNLGPEHGYLQRQADQINDLWYDIRAKFAKLSFTPLRYPIQPTPPQTPEELEIRHTNDISVIEDFVEKLERKVRDLFRMVKLVDWMVAFEIFETQSSEPLGFFASKASPMSHDDEEVLQDIFSLLSSIRQGNSSIPVLDTLPKSLKELCGLRTDIMNWVLAQIVDPGLNAERRAHRISTLLKCLAISRKRMSGMDLIEDYQSGATRQHVPSFVAGAIAAALVDSLEAVIPKEIKGAQCTQPMTPCAGWIMERLLEIVCYVPNMVVENNRLINFDKRRYVYNFIHNFTNISSQSPLQENFPSQLTPISLPAPRGFDMRAIKELSNRENAPIKNTRTKIFWRLLHHEQEKVRRDAKQKDAIERLQRQQQRAEHRRQPTAIKIDPADKRSGRRLGVNSIFKAVRPISMAFTGGWTPPQSSARIVAPGDLPTLKGVEHGKKPSSTIDLTTVASVSCPKTTRDHYMWRVRTDHGISYLFQAVSEKELEEWLKTIEVIRGIATSDGGESVDGLTMTSQNRTPQPVFGVSLEDLCRRDNVKVPVVVEMLLGEIELRGINEVGIYRVPGSLSSINALKLALDSGEYVQMDDDRWYDINAIAGAFKMFMRELPDRALGAEALQQLKNVTVNITNEDERAAAYREVMVRLPSCNYHFLRRVYVHFNRIASNATINKMHAVNLAIVFGMGLSPTNPNMPLGVSPDLGLYQTMVKIWITHTDLIFPEVEDDDDHESISATQAESLDMHSSEPSSPALEHTSTNSPRMSMDDKRPELKALEGLVI